ncbi:hypothetical protein OS493_031004 [Desmophyllum pertusum]|uniref:ILEI/PANDER domain-containing protein n=1 Tax=Desmophyllum pertusum TaxID=174260 RepID=A0A9W9Z8T7_9CNID|nr:hypothetical protein OS493_031004 [Desmophyllum pertusum]
MSWLDAAGKATTTHAVMLGSNLAITNTTIAPQAEHTVTATIGTIWGASASGIHVKESSVWKLKAIWNCFGYIDVHICSGGYTDPSIGNCLGNTASIKVDGVERALNKKAYNVVVLTRHGNLIDSRSFNTHDTSTADDQMGAFIDGLPDNVIVLMAVKDEATYGNNASEEDKMGADVAVVTPRSSESKTPW